MEENTVSVDKLIRWPPANGHWYLARVTNSMIEFKNPVHPTQAKLKHLGTIGSDNIRDYPESLSGRNGIKSSPSTDPLQEGDNVLARIQLAPGYQHKSDEYRYEMGEVLAIRPKTDVLIRFPYGVTEVVEYRHICHMFLGGPTRLDAFARGIYPRQMEDSGKEFFSIAPAAEKIGLPPVVATPLWNPVNGVAGPSTSAITSEEPQQTPAIHAAGAQSSSTFAVPGRSSDPSDILKALLADILRHLHDHDYIKRHPSHRKSELLSYSDRFGDLPQNVKASKDGENFTRDWVRLVRHHHHNIPPGTKPRIPAYVNQQWYRDI